MKFELRIDRIVPSPTIFPYDMTYSYSDSIREYDGLALVTIEPIVKDVKDEEKTDMWKTLFFIEHLSGDETSKKIVDLALGNPEIVFLSDEKNNASKRMNMLMHFNVLSKRLSEEFARYAEKAFLSKYKRLWNYNYELHNLAFHTLLLAESYRKKIAYDVLKLREKIGTNAPIEVRETVKDIAEILAYAINENISKNTTRNFNKPDKVKSPTVGKILEDKLKEMGHGKFLILVFPQMLRREAIKRLKMQINTLRILIKFIISKTCSPISVRVIGYDISKEQAKHIAWGIKCLNIDSEVLISDNLENLLSKISEKIKEYDKVIIIILQDYNKNVISKMMDYVVSKTALIIVTSEITYSVSESYTKERLVKAYSPWFNEDSEKILEKLDRSKILIYSI